MNTDLLLATASFALMLTRESMPGLIVLFPYRDVERCGKNRFRQGPKPITWIWPRGSDRFEAAILPPADAERLTDQIENTTKLTLALAGGVYFLRRNSIRPWPCWSPGVPAAVKLAEIHACLGHRQRHVNENGYLLGDGRHLLALPSWTRLSGARPRSSRRAPWSRISMWLTRPTGYERLLGLAAAAYREVPDPLGPGRVARQVRNRGSSCRGHGGRIAARRSGAGGSGPAKAADRPPFHAAAGKDPCGTARQAPCAMNSSDCCRITSWWTGARWDLAVEEQVRENVEKTIEVLRVLGITKQVLLSTSGEEYTEFLAGRLGCRDWHARQTPGGKAAIVKELKDSGRLVMTVGSSQDDVEAMAQSDFSWPWASPDIGGYVFAAGRSGAHRRYLPVGQTGPGDLLQNLLLARAGNIIGVGSRS